MDKILFTKIVTAYDTHESLIVGVDFDDTVFPFNKTEENIERCQKVVRTLLELKSVLGVDLIICLYSVADEQSLVYKEHIMECYGLKPQFINEGPMDKKWNSKKPFFNILLDDKAGLDSALETLIEFKNQLT